MRQPAAQRIKGETPPLSELLGDPAPRGVDVPLGTALVSVLVLFTLLGVVKLFFPHRLNTAPLPTSARIHCPPPSEFETQLVFLNARADGAIDVTCGPAVGARGTYPGARR